MQYLVVGSGGPGFASPEETVEVLERGILPTFDALMKLEEDGKILAGGLPVGDRALTFIAEAASHEELDRMLRNIPAWEYCSGKSLHSNPLRGELLKKERSSKNSSE